MALDSDLRRVREALEKVIANAKWGSPEERSSVILEEFTFRDIAYTVSIWIDDVEAVKQAKSELNETIWLELDAAGISLA